MAEKTRTATDRYDQFHYRYVWPYGALIYQQWIEYARVRRHLKRSNAGGRTLELASGGIPYSGLYRKMVGDLVLSDIDPILLKRQEKFFGLLRKYVMLDNRSLPFPDGSFNTVVAVNSVALSRAEVNRVLADKGLFIEVFFLTRRVHQKIDGELIDCKALRRKQS